MKAVVAAFNQEKALVGAFSVIVQPVVESMDRFAALVVRWLAPAPATAPQLENEHNSVSRLETAATGAGDGETEVSLLFVAL